MSQQHINVLGGAFFIIGYLSLLAGVSRYSDTPEMSSALGGIYLSLGVFILCQKDGK
jgi:hypothetical protein